MKRLIRIAGVALLVLVLAAGGALFFSNARVSSLLMAAVGIETAAEEFLTEAVGTDVTIESLAILLDDGEMRVRGLTVGNPEGFHTEHAFEADEIRIVMELGSLLDDPVIIREIAVESPLVTHEFCLEGSNLETIQRNADPSAGSGEGPGSGASRWRVLIENLYIRGGRVATRACFLESLEELPDIHLGNISSGEGGIVAADIIREILTEIISGIAANAPRSVAPIRERAREVGGRITERVSKVVEDIRREIGKGSESARETLERKSESALEALQEKAETARGTVEKGTESARQALEKGTDKVRRTLEKFLGR